MMNTSPVRLHTNYAPNAQEIEEIREAIARGLREMVALEAEMTQIDAANALRLKEKHDTPLRDAVDHHALFSPVRQLPFDILQEIFIHTLPTDCNASMKEYECPLLLTRVCSEWRQIALSIRQLWATIHITIPISKPKYPDSAFTTHKLEAEFALSHIAAVTEWLARAGGVPLKVSLYEPAYYAINQGFEIYFPAVLPFLNSCKKIDIACGTPEITNILALNSENVPLLESFSIDSQSVLQVDSFVDLKLCDAPRLRKLSIRGSYDLHILECGWSNLTHLKIVDTIRPGWYSNAEFSLPNLARVLYRCPLLEDFHIEVEHPAIYTPILAASPTISFPCLRSLSVHVSLSDMHTFFALLDTPVLDMLAFHIRGEYAEGPGLVKFLSQSSTTVRVLHVDHLMFGPQSSAVLNVLKSFSQLRSLTLYNQSLFQSDWSPEPIDFLLGDEFFDLLAPASGPAPFPYLENLEMPQRTKYTEDGLLYFLKRRQNMANIGVSRLRHLQATFPYPQETSIDEELEPLKMMVCLSNLGT